VGPDGPDRGPHVLPVIALYFGISENIQKE